MGLFPVEEKIFIKDLRVGQKIRTFFKVQSLAKRTKRDGNFYLTLDLMDKTGSMPGKVWDNVDILSKTLHSGSIYEFEGMVNEYQGRKEIKIDTVKNISPSDKNVHSEDFLEQASFDTERMFDEMIAVLKENIENSHLLALLDAFNHTYRDAFSRHYGAQRIHHAYPGGLLQHTSSIIRMAVIISDHFSLQKEILLMGALFHDLGKLQEFTSQPSLGITDEGGLIGHIVLGNTMFLNLVGTIEDFPEQLRTQIQHLIVSHHGEKEFGAPELPKTQEAFTLYILDLLDSKIHFMKEALQNHDQEAHFTEYFPVISRRLYVSPEDE